MSAGVMVVGLTVSGVAQNDYGVPPATVAQAIEASVMPAPVVSPALDLIALITQDSMLDR